MKIPHMNSTAACGDSGPTLSVTARRTLSAPAPRSPGVRPRLVARRRSVGFWAAAAFAIQVHLFNLDSSRSSACTHAHGQVTDGRLATAHARAQRRRTRSNAMAVSSAWPACLLTRRGATPQTPAESRERSGCGCDPNVGGNKRMPACVNVSVNVRVGVFTCGPWVLRQSDRRQTVNRGTRRASSAGFHGLWLGILSGCVSLVLTD